jgi:ketosteroid isomerase-like protein
MRMSEADLEVVRRGFAAMDRGDVEAVLAGMDPDIEWYPTLDFVDIGPFRGHAGIRRLMDLILAAFDSYSLQPEELIDAGEHVVAPVRQTGRGKGSGIDVDVRYILVFTMRGGRALRVESFYDRKQALAAAGLV